MGKGWSIIRINNRDKFLLSICPFIILVISIIKSCYLSQKISGDLDLTRIMLPLVVCDLHIIGAALLIALLGSSLAVNLRDGLGLVWRGVLQILLLALSLVYLLDTLGLIFVDEGFSIEAVEKYVKELSVSFQFLSAPWILAFIILILSAFFKIYIPRRQAWPFAIIGLASFVPLLSGWPVLGTLMDPYRSAIISSILHLSSDNSSAIRYTDTDLEFYSKFTSIDAHPLLIDDKKDVLLLVVESLSSIDSNRLWGINNTLPHFDEISKDGILFRNFFANTRQSEGGMIATFNTLSPIPFPGSNYDWYKIFAQFPSIFKDLSALGFHTEVLSTFPTSFLNNGTYLKRIGFDLVRGRDEVEAFRSAPQFAFGSPSDETLYREFFRRYAELKNIPKPKFLALFTASSHLPWTDPNGGKNSEENVWRYVDKELAKFYEGVKSIGFLDNGYLIIMGDHRKRELRTEREVRELGEISKARIPLLIVGPGITKGVIDDRYFQQADLFSKLKLIQNPDAALSPVSFFLDAPPHKLLVIDEAQPSKNGYNVNLSGTHLSWEGARPENYLQIEFEIHKQRALSQMIKR